MEFKELNSPFEVVYLACDRWETFRRTHQQQAAGLVAQLLYLCLRHGHERMNRLFVSSPVFPGVLLFIDVTTHFTINNQTQQLCSWRPFLKDIVVYRQ